MLSRSGTMGVFVYIYDFECECLSVCLCACSRQSKPEAKQSKRGRRRRLQWLGPQGQTPIQTWTQAPAVTHSIALLVCHVACAAVCTWLVCCARCASTSNAVSHISCVFLPPFHMSYVQDRGKLHAFHSECSSLEKPG